MKKFTEEDKKKAREKLEEALHQNKEFLLITVEEDGNFSDSIFCKCSTLSAMATAILYTISAEIPQFLPAALIAKATHDSVEKKVKDFQERNPGLNVEELNASIFDSKGSA